MENKLATFIINGLKAVNEITENIDFKKTTEESIAEQLKASTNKSFMEINNNKDVDEDFFAFLKKNEKPLQNIKLYIIVPQKQQTLKDHIDQYFSEVQTKHKEDKMFYFYFQLVLMEKFLRQFNKRVPRNDLKEGLKMILANQCLREKKEMSKCLGTLENDSVEVMSEFGCKIDQKCKPQREKLERCIIGNFSKK